MARLAEREYWESRYALDPEPFEWYVSYASCVEYSTMLKQTLRQTDKILILGAGTSRLAEEMIADGFTSIYNIDSSPVCIDILNERHDRLGLNQVINSAQDVCSMDLENSSFDAVIDKATIDSILCAESKNAAERALSEVSRVLRADGVFLLLSKIGPSTERLMPLVQRPDLQWTCETSTVKESARPGGPQSEFFLYLMRRTPPEANECSNAVHAAELVPASRSASTAADSSRRRVTAQ